MYPKQVGVGAEKRRTGLRDLIGPGSHGRKTQSLRAERRDLIGPGRRD
jgi:hypothetical protein